MGNYDQPGPNETVLVLTEISTVVTAGSIIMDKREINIAAFIIKRAFRKPFCKYSMMIMASMVNCFQKMVCTRIAVIILNKVYSIKNRMCLSLNEPNTFMAYRHK